MPTVATRGLEDVVASPSAISFIDGQRGILAYRGYSIHDLAEKSSFPETAYLLWHGQLPTPGQLRELETRLREAATAPEPVLRWLRALPRQAAPMDVLRTAVSSLGLYDPDAADMSPEANRRKALRLLAQTPTLVAAFARLRQGQEPLAPASDLGLAANFLYMLSGARPDDTAARALDIALILHADHEFNASTFAARVTAATLSDIHSAVTSALGALKGPLHGGANEAVIKFLLSIGDADPLPAVRQRLAEHAKISGFGHRVYRTEDPRATHLRRMSEELGRKTGNVRLFQLSQRIEQFMKDEKGLNANVDFYSASLYYDLGIAVDLYTPIFASARMSGWTAHVLEQYADNRLIRPRAEYSGPPVPQTYVPLDQRA
ncbi:MAG: citrate/2-methylcitrate synthase [Terriglobales bacterium]